MYDVWYDVEVMMITMGAAGWVGYVLLQTVRSFPGGCTNDRPGESVREHSGIR